jgi:dihydrofolate reductase
MVTRLYLTRVHAQIEGDTRLPEIDWEQWQLVSSEPHTRDASNEFDFTFEVFDRRSNADPNRAKK